MDYGKQVESLYSAFSRGDIGCILSQLADDVEWVVFGPESIPFTGTHIGRHAVGRVLAMIDTTQKGSRVAVTEILAAGKNVVATVRYSGRVAATGRAFDTSAVHMFTFRNGKVASFRDYFDTAQLEEAYSAVSRSAAA